MSDAVWERLPDPEDLSQLYSGYLATQCSLLVDAVALGALIRLNNQGGGELIARWPDLDSDTSVLDSAWQRAVEERCGVVLPLKSASSVHANYTVALPLLLEGRVVAVVAMAVQVSNESQLEWVMGHLEWGSGFLLAPLLSRRLEQQQHTTETLRWSNELLAAVLAQGDFHDAVQRLVADLAARLEAERVSMGVVQGRRVKVLALSHSADFSEKIALLRYIEAAMVEAVEQATPLLYPVEEGEARIVLAQRELAEQQGHNSVLTLPIYDYDLERPFAALTLERAGNRPFSGEEQRLCQGVASLAGTALREKWLNQRPLHQKLNGFFLQQSARMFGRGYTGRKLFALTATLILLFFSIADGEYWLASDATLESRDRHAVTAPFDGYIADAHARAGDRVAEGTVLARLDERDLRLERIKWVSQKAQLSKQYSDAQAKYDRAQMTILKPQIEQAQAEIELAQNRLARAAVKAPSTGLVISGDLSQQLGDAVRQGDELFVVAALNHYRLILQVRESRVADLEVGQQGRLLLKSLPRQPLRFTITRITPVTVAEEGVSYYRVEAQLEQVITGLRPGMRGVAKVYIDERRLIAIWSRDLIEWLQLALWRWWG